LRRPKVASLGKDTARYVQEEKVWDEIVSQDHGQLYDLSLLKAKARYHI
jgi:hypothetical protein